MKITTIGIDLAKNVFQIHGFYALKDAVVSAYEAHLEATSAS